ncbi:hypothetical protein PT974_01519 [Cladobotryum mycophilum]|uniref:Uncharacterized protein n=1 Tax=Cladobotryum mycophilum TaxID=491253 RepID=A0ABR0T3W8_9HYPO
MPSSKGPLRSIMKTIAQDMGAEHSSPPNIVRKAPAVVKQKMSAPPPYRLIDEPAPAHQFFTPEFQEILEKGVRAAQRTVTAIENSGSILQDKALRDLLQDAKKLNSFQPASTKTFAVLGDSGTGKSSLINSLLHVPGIAKTGDMGSACTAVVTEFRQKTEAHTEPITIEVGYLSLPEIEDLVTELLWSFRKAYLPQDEYDGLGDGPRVSESAESVESAQAWSTLEAAFGHHDGFSDDLLKDNSDRGLIKAENQLIRWCHQIKWPGGDFSGTWTDTARNADERCEKTEIFMSNELWPFTKIIRIYLDSQVLKSGIVLADLPGLQDTNLARVRVTQDYLVNCSNILLVTNISRAATDRSLKDSLSSIISHHIPLEWDESTAKSMTIAVVCTKTDEINQPRAKRELCGPGKRISLKELQQIELDIAVAKDYGDPARAKELGQMCKLMLVDARNEHVKQKLREAYAANIPNQNLDVFCVSNKWYEKHCEDGNVPFVVASGVPELRKYCRVAAADVQLREARHFLEASLVSVINSVEMYASDTISTESIKKIEGALDKTTTSVHRAIDVFISDFNSCFETQIIKFADERHSRWVEAAEGQWQQWSRWSHNQFRAWRRNNGEYSTRSRGPENWNNKIIRPMRVDMRPLWNLVEESIPVFADRFSKSVRDALKELETLIIDAAPSYAHPFMRSSVDAQMKNSVYVFGNSREEFEKRLKHLRQYALESNSNSCIVGRMIPTYRKAISVTGTGSSRVQKDMVRERITYSKFFPKFYEKVSKRQERMMKQTRNGLAGQFSDVLQRIRLDVHLALSPDKIDPQQQAEKEGLLLEMKPLRWEAQKMAIASSSG